jgi:AraC family transcriptional regulator
MQNILDLTGYIPISNVDGGEKVLENYSTSSIAVTTTNKLTNITRGTHFHDSYEFVICQADIPSTKIEKKLSDRSNNALFAINPMQEHGMAYDVKGFGLCGIHIEKDFMQGVSEEIYGSPNIIFSNESFDAGHELRMLLNLFLDEIKYDQFGKKFAIENLSMLIAGILTRQVRHNFPARAHNAPEGKINNIKKVIDYMNENFSSDIAFTDIAGLAKMDRFGFIRSFKAYTGKTPYEYLLDLKIEKAKRMLMTNKFSITEISMICNFSSHSHFTSTFRRKTGVSPSEFRKGL